MPIITLTSDFGLQDHTSAVVKGLFLQHLNETPNFIDVTHSVANYNLPQAAYILNGILQNFTSGSFHCIFVNLFENNSKELLIFKQNDQYILTADNGFVNLIKSNSSINVFKIPLDQKRLLNLANFVQTMAKCINWLNEKNKLEDIGEIKVDYIDKLNLKPIINENCLEGYIIFVDQFENVITNITKTNFNEVRNNRNFKIVFKRDEIIEKISDSYGDVPQGEKLALFNSTGYLEIAINQGNAAGLFGLNSYTSNHKNNTAYLQKALYYQTIKIYFED